jgi:hypothetical protein
MFEHWEPVEAKVISREFTWNSPAHAKPQYKYVVEVQAPGTLAGANEGREFSHEAASAIPAPDTANELAKLADLKTNGLLTDAEFAAAKQKPLGL